MNDQEIFNRVYKHLLTQNARAMYDDICVYRTGSGVSCAVGCLIQDAAYTRTIEGAALARLVASNGNPAPRERALEKALKLSGIQPASYMLLRELQSLHDCEHPRYWKSGLKRIADRYDLSVPKTTQGDR